MKLSFYFVLLCLFTFRATTEEQTADSPSHDILVIVGAPGEASFATGFIEAADHWIEAAHKAEARLSVVGTDPEDANHPDKQQVAHWLQALEQDSSTPAWVVYIGHGTHNSRQTLLNLRGPDLDSQILSEWISPLQRPFIFIHGGSASAPFIPAISGPNRIIISATRSAEEINYARFGERFASILNREKGDIDQDGQTSLLEAFISTAQDVQLIYKESGRLASEHTLIDDNGDGIGTPADWFKGTQVTQQAKDNREPDGFRSHQIAFIESEQEKSLSSNQKAERDRLEREVDALRKKKESMDEADYYDSLERLFLKLSQIYLTKPEPER